jgi:hypothetical protein
MAVQQHCLGSAVPASSEIDPLLPIALEFQMVN